MTPESEDLLRRIFSPVEGLDDRPYHRDSMLEFGPEDEFAVFYRFESDRDDFHRWHYAEITGVELAETGEAIPFGDTDPWWLAHGEEVQKSLDERANEPPDDWD